MNDNIGKTNAREEVQPDPQRLRAFAVFFKRYMSLSSLIVASLPIGVAGLNAIPTYKAQTRYLTVFTSLVCFLLLGFIFFNRHYLGKLFFPRNTAASSVAMKTLTVGLHYVPSYVLDSASSAHIGT